MECATWHIGVVAGRPLTAALSPEYRGEGVDGDSSSARTVIDHPGVKNAGLRLPTVRGKMGPTDARDAG